MDILNTNHNQCAFIGFLLVLFKGTYSGKTTCFRISKWKNTLKIFARFVDGPWQVSNIKVSKHFYSNL